MVLFSACILDSLGSADDVIVFILKKVDISFRKWLGEKEAARFIIIQAIICASMAVINGCLLENLASFVSLVSDKYNNSFLRVRVTMFN